MPARPALVVTSIAGDTNPILQQLARGAHAAGWRFLIIGDTKSPATFSLPHCEFLSVADQLAWSDSHNLTYASLCPTKHYARKNIGYLEAIRAGAPFIVETDDDNQPIEFAPARDHNQHSATFFAPRSLLRAAKVLRDHGWLNVYRYWSATDIWPRGFPLEHIQQSVPSLADTPAQPVACPIQQGLADENPDVDAIYRLTRSLPVYFGAHPDIALAHGTWCPFNSQNTTFFPPAFPLLYLPALCSFRMTDIWRSFIAQRICHANGWPILVHNATVRQLRNDHNLMRDFEDEVSGYTHNSKICTALQALTLQPGEQHTLSNLRACYTELIAHGFLPREELALLDAWLHDLTRVRGESTSPLIEVKAPAHQATLPR
jgi:hypothetical protein